MFLPTRYKLYSLNRNAPKTQEILKRARKLKSFQITDEEEDNESEPIQESEEEVSSKITMKDAGAIAQLVTQIDEESERGIEALYWILVSIRDGASVVDSITICCRELKIDTKKRRK